MQNALMRDGVRNTSSKGWLAGLRLATMLLFVLVLSFELIVQAPRASQADAQLEVEFRSVKPLPNATQVSHSVSHKTIPGCW